MTHAQAAPQRPLAPRTAHEISVLIVGYNSSAYLPDCLASLDACLEHCDGEILFVNNGTDGSEELIRANFPNVRIMPSLGNTGFAAANNYLAKHALGRWLLLLNPDTRLFPGAIEALIEAAASCPQFQALGGVSVSRQGATQQDHGLELPTLGRLTRALAMGASWRGYHPPASGVRQVEALNGGFMMVRRDWWNRLGGFDPGFFLYAEELDFFKRLNIAGGRAALVPASRIFHDFGSGEVFSPHRIRFLTTGNAHYFHKHFSPAYAYACIFVLWATSLKRYIGGRLLALRSERHARMSRGFAAVARAPWTWMWGYKSTGADPRRSC